MASDTHPTEELYREILNKATANDPSLTTINLNNLAGSKNEWVMKKMKWRKRRMKNELRDVDIFDKIFFFFLKKKKCKIWEQEILRDDRIECSKIIINNLI